MRFEPIGLGRLPVFSHWYRSPGHRARAPGRNPAPQCMPPHHRRQTMEVLDFSLVKRWATRSIADGKTGRRQR